MIGATLDASVLAAGVAAADEEDSTPGKIIRLWQSQVFRLVISGPILAEVERALAKPYFRRRLTPSQTEGAVRLLRAKADWTELTVTVDGVASHWEDDLVLASAVSAEARYLVTGDRELLAVGAHLGSVLTLEWRSSPPGRSLVSCNGSVRSPRQRNAEERR